MYMHMYVCAVTLELGGKNACIILEDADLETAVRIACGGNYFNAGQICVGITRVFVPEGMRDAFLDKAASRARSRTLGDQWSGAEQGPLADEAQMNRVLRYTLSQYIHNIVSMCVYMVVRLQVY
jgi:acyl-CoA reductase-like NAD-dependent aldehyde dehydrogenase